MSCVVYGCPNNSFANTDSSIHYYVFPKHPMIAQQWIDACGWPPGQVDPNIARICSVHFDENSYTTEIKIIDYVTCYTKVLKYDAVPTLYLPTTTQIVLKEADAEEVPQEKLIVFAVPSSEDEVLLNQITDSNKQNYIELQVQPVAFDNLKLVETVVEETIDMEKYKHIKTEEQLTTLQAYNKTLREKVMRMETNLKQLRNGYTQQMKTYREKDLELSKLHHEYLKTKRSFLSLHDQRMLLSKVFSESQIKILSGKKKIYWSNDDMAVGYTIRHLSNKRCYMYLTKELNIPLPAVSSIKRWMTLKNSPLKKKLGAASSDEKKNQNESGESE